MIAPSEFFLPANLHAEFPILRQQVYLNHAAVSPLPTRAVEEMERYLEECSKGGLLDYPEWIRRIRTTRAAAAALINADPGEVAFAHNTSHGLMTVASGMEWKEGDTVVVEENTFAANWHAWGPARRAGAAVWTWPERNFRYDPEELEARLKEGGVRLVAITSAGYGTGFRHDLEAIGLLCRRYGALFCVDAIQTMGAFPIDVVGMHIDFLAADGHKWLLGPEGAGIFFCRASAMEQLGEHVVGWMGRENPNDHSRLDQPPAGTARRFEEGALNVPGILALGGSLSVLAQVGIGEISRRVRENARILEDGMEALGWEIVSPKGADPAASGIVAARHPRKNAIQVASNLARLDVSAAERRGFLRFSPHFYNEPAGLQRALEALETLSA